MSKLRLWQVLTVYGVVLGALCVGLSCALAIDRAPRAPVASIVSVWVGGERRARAVSAGDPTPLLRAEGDQPGARRVIEEVLDEAPILALSSPIFGGSFVAAVDGVKVSYRDQVAYATLDDLVKLGAYGAKYSIAGYTFSLGLRRDAVLDFLAGELHVARAELLAEGHFVRVAMRRRVVPRTGVELSPDSELNAELHVETLRASVLAAGHYLARSLHPDGSYRYEIDALTGDDVEGYNWPRHAGATWFLVRAASYANDPVLKAAARRAAQHLVDHSTHRCGEHECIGTGSEMNLGSAALSLLAYVELAESGIAPEFGARAQALSAFIRSLQREDGEFKHIFDLELGRAVDVQKAFFAGEAALALSRMHRLSNDPRDLRAASRALTHLVDRPAGFVTSRYFWIAEHWTCQAMQDLWERAPNPRALEFCLQWQELTRNGMRAGDLAPQYDGCYAPKWTGTPRTTESASRMEAGVATLIAARRADLPAQQVKTLEQGVRRALRFLLRHQFRPGPTQLMPDPQAVHGGFPASVIDLKVRIDYPQHAGAALLRYLQLLESEAPAPAQSLAAPPRAVPQR
ncbi:MAG: hypothetical protein RLZZ450_1384 [Pseudomonadota bacterium]